MNTERTEVVSKRRAFSEEDEPACKKTKMTEEIPLHVTEMMSSNPVILENVFSHLSPRDIKTAALVCRTWRQVVEIPRYWTWAKVRINSSNFQERISANRTSFVAVRSDMLENEQLDVLCNLVQTNDMKVEKLTTSFTPISADLFSNLHQAILKMEKVTLRAELSEEQLEEIFRKIAETEDLKLKSLDYYSRTKITSVKADIFTEAAIRLERIAVRKLSDELVNALFRKIPMNEEMRLKRVFDVDVSTVPVEIFSEAVVKLESYYCYSRRPSFGHISALFRKIAQTEDMKLKEKLENDNNYYIMMSNQKTKSTLKAMIRLKSRKKWRILRRI